MDFVWVPISSAAAPDCGPPGVTAPIRHRDDARQTLRFYDAAVPSQQPDDIA